jgi:hypothetical protein
MDPLTAVGTGLAILGSKEILNKILGPTADYLGNETRGLVQKCNVNLSNVFNRAKEKLGSRLEETGAVSPRVLRHVIEDGRFADDDLVVEYYGGLLAGSKNENGTDDQALPYLAKVQQMSSHQLRLHFIFYYELLRLHKNTGINLGTGPKWPSLSLIVPHELFLKSMPAGMPPQKYWGLMAHAVVGLSQQGLISSYEYGEMAKRIKEFTGAPSNAIYMAPNFLGAELFMWALGIESPSGHQFFDIDLNTIKKVIPIDGEAIAKTATAG